MKYFFFLIFSLPVLADISLDDAYRREKTFLLAQKEALLKMKTSLNTSLVQRKSKAENDIKLKQNELSSLMLRNQELHEEYKALEKITKESSQMSGQLEKNSLKINENLSSLKRKLGLSHQVPTELDPVKHFEGLLDDVLILVSQLASEKWRSHAFLDQNDHLVQGEVLFRGLHSAWGKFDGKLYSLVPYNNEFLKISNAFSGQETYLFEASFERLGLKAAKTWKESVADAVPGIIMTVIMLCVLGLFIMLAMA
jgi:hypothetical protein